MEGAEYLLVALLTDMEQEILYSVACDIGNMRPVNQDNFWCMGRYLDLDNRGLPCAVNGRAALSERPVFAVFDGMGGEQLGEHAAYTAADCFDSCISSHRGDVNADVLGEMCMTVNRAICDFRADRHVGTMGTTGALISFTAGGLSLCNIGDSRIYRLRGRRLTQLSVDHNETGFSGGKAPLSQFLGVPESDFIIEPFLAEGAYKRGDRYLICSDGLSDMADISDICDVMLNTPIGTCAQALVDLALAMGGKDNITVIVCEVVK